jgi:hypothetical protein
MFGVLSADFLTPIFDTYEQAYDTIGTLSITILLHVFSLIYIYSILSFAKDRVRNPLIKRSLGNVVSMLPVAFFLALLITWGIYLPPIIHYLVFIFGVTIGLLMITVGIFVLIKKFGGRAYSYLESKTEIRIQETVSRYLEIDLSELLDDTLRAGIVGGIVSGVIFLSVSPALVPFVQENQIRFGVIEGSDVQISLSRYEDADHSRSFPGNISFSEGFYDIESTSVAYYGIRIENTGNRRVENVQIKIKLEYCIDGFYSSDTVWGGVNDIHVWGSNCPEAYHRQKDHSIPDVNWITVSFKSLPPTESQFIPIRVDKRYPLEREPRGKIKSLPDLSNSQASENNTLEATVSYEWWYNDRMYTHESRCHLPPGLTDPEYWKQADTVSTAFFSNGNSPYSTSC